MKKRYFLFIFSSSLAFSSVVDPNFSYQDYLDFALNKGKFKVGSENISIASKDSSKKITLNAPMIDFSATNVSRRLKGEFTNIGQSYIVSAAHMTWYDKNSSPSLAPLKQGDVLHFANVANRVVGASNDFRNRRNYDIDFAVFKMQKLNLNASANLSKELDFISLKNKNEQNESLRYKDNFQESEDFSQGKGKLYNKDRYEFFVREGTGVQGIGDISSQVSPIKIAQDDKYHTGGFVTLGDKEDIRYNFFLRFENFNKNIRNDFTSSSAPGDSGSALYVYDKMDKKWYLIGVISGSDCTLNFATGFNCTLVDYALINQPLIDEFKANRTINIAGGNYTLNNQSLIHNGKTIQGVEFISEKYSGLVTFNNTNRTDYEKRIKEMANSKDLYFHQKGILSLVENADMGASVLNFTPNSNWEITGDKWLIGGGIYADTQAKVTYNALLKENDFLYKMGQGELEILSSNLNSGLRMGEGLVSLIGKGEKFGEIYINGGTLKISSADNINFNTLYLNGGTLDLNGQSLSTSSIKANSNNVFITSQKDHAKLTFINSQDYIYHWEYCE